MPAGAAVALAAGSMAGSVANGFFQAQVAGEAAEAQLGQQRRDRAEALKYADPSPMELQQLEQAITVNTQEIGRKQKLLDSADPALIEAGKQALSLLQGEEAKSLAPIKRQRDEQRRSLEATLMQQLGPDFANSSAGAQALNQFDAQTNDVLAQQQDRTLANLLGVTQNTSQANQLTPNIATSMQIAGQRGNVNARQINAIAGNRIDPQLAYAGQLAMHQNLGNVLGQTTGLATAYVAGGYGKPDDNTTSTFFSKPTSTTINTYNPTARNYGALV